MLLGSRVLVMAAGPGRIVAELPIPLPRDSGTDVATLRGTPDFARLRAELTRTLSDSVR